MVQLATTVNISRYMKDGVTWEHRVTTVKTYDENGTIIDTKVTETDEPLNKPPVSVQDVFKAIAGADNAIDQAELKKTLSSQGIPPEFVDQYFPMADVNADGKLSQDEFTKLYEALPNKLQELLAKGSVTATPAPETKPAPAPAPAPETKPAPPPASILPSPGPGPQGWCDELNLVRTKPKEYAQLMKTTLLPLYHENYLQYPGQVKLVTQEGPKAVQEAIDTLLNTSPMDPLKLDPVLSQAAKAHVDNMGPGGFTGHYGRDGSKPKDRIERVGNWKGSIAENIAYGSPDARKAIMQLLTDDGVPTRGHRVNILRKDFTVVGIAVGPHKAYNQHGVINFATAFTPFL